MKSNPKYSALYFTPNQTLFLCQSPLWVELFLFRRYSGTGEIWKNWPQIHQRMCSDTQKVIQSFQHHVSHWMGSIKFQDYLGGWFILVSVYLRYQANLEKLSLNALIFLKLSIVTILTYPALNLLSRMGYISSFGQTIQ